MNAPTFLWRIETQVPAEARLIAEDIFETRSMAVTAFERDGGALWAVEGFTDAEPDGETIEKELNRALRKAGEEIAARVICDLVPPRDWLADNMNAFPPLHIGRYFIHASHFDGTRPAGSVQIRLDPGTAFGSGEHASTAGCLTVLDQLAREKRFHHPLDMGCGSGILAIAAAKTWRVPVIASDHDPEAARVTTLNARTNGVGPLVRSICGAGYQSRPVRRGRPYDLIIANILARPLIAMAADVGRQLRPTRDGGGTVILSGLLERDGNWVAAAHRRQGLTLQRRHLRDGWLTLVMSR